MNIAVLGIRGIPANYGGFETFAERLACALTARGHTLTVYGRSNNVKTRQRLYKGVKLVILPTISHKYLDTIAHTFLCVWHAAFFGKYDLVLVCNSANAAFCVIPRIFRQKVLLNVDGLEWQRKKWNAFGKMYYKISEFLATFCATDLVTDALLVQDYYREKFGKETNFIPYGAEIKKVPPGDTLERFGLKPQQYVLYVSRLEPENNAHRVVKAFEQTTTRMKLAVVGDAPYATSYIQDLKKTTDPRIQFTGYVFGHAYEELQSNAYCYVQATEVGGTHPALLEGMAFGNCVLANDVPEHREVLGDAGVYFSRTDDNDLRAQLQMLLDQPGMHAAYQRKALKRIEEKFTWERIATEYETLLYRMLGISAPPSVPAMPEIEDRVPALAGVGD
jgi:glycosyltransferase involved in cell wall biosynthesis